MNTTNPGSLFLNQVFYLISNQNTIHLRELVCNQFQNVSYSHKIIFIKIIYIKTDNRDLEKNMDRVANSLPHIKV